MLDFYFSYRGVLKRLRSGALGGEMDRLAEHFFTLGYKRASAKCYLSRIAHFSQFAATRSGPMPILQDVVDSYLRTFTTDSPRIGAVSALGHARRVAPERFIVSVPNKEDDPDAPLLASFSDYLRRVRGLEPKTLEGVLLGGRRFLDWFHHHHPRQNLEMLTAEHVLAAAEHRLSLSATSSSRTAATSHIRTFLRFLYWAGHHRQDLACLVPRTPSWRLAHLPPRLAWDDVRQAIDAIGATTPVDIRDRAVLLLLATTGIRNGELRAIRLKDIDWRTGEVFVHRHAANAGLHQLQPGTYGAGADPAKPASGVAHYVPFVRRPPPGCRRSRTRLPFPAVLRCGSWWRKSCSTMKSKVVSEPGHRQPKLPGFS